MNFNELVKARRSVRQYTSKKVTSKQVEALIESASWAPSSCNRQPWYFIAVNDNEKKLDIAKWVSNLPQVKHNGVLLIAFIDLRKYKDYSTNAEINESKNYLIDVGVALQNICLTATNLGLSTCIIAGGIGEQEISSYLGVPSYFKLCALVCVGYPKVNPTPPARDSIQSFFDWNFFNEANRKSARGATDQSLKTDLINKGKRVARKFKKLIA